MKFFIKKYYIRSIFKRNIIRFRLILTISGIRIILILITALSLPS